MVQPKMLIECQQLADMCGVHTASKGKNCKFNGMGHSASLAGCPHTHHALKWIPILNKEYILQ